MSIEVEGLTYVYMPGSPFEKIALKNINLHIEKGEFVGIIGHTGSGKSTLVQHFNGLLKATSGKVLINGNDVKGKNLKLLRNQVGMVFQYPEHQLFEETVYKDIAFGLQKQGLSSEEADIRVKEAIYSVGLGQEILDKSPFELSGGQKRRTAIAGVLAMKPEILVLDEPAAGLDPKGRDELFTLIRNLHRDAKLTVVLVSHSMEDTAKLVQKVIVMNEGKIEMSGNVTEVFRNAEKLEQIGLSAPEITYLFKKLKKSFSELSDEIFTVEDAKKEILRFVNKHQ
ncbi:MAG TPA: energy-coupling factor transporter ATPase [Clostridia bacterium]|nr:energy-coupling factor transporter ATPase [Clostridia bacterium]